MLETWKDEDEDDDDAEEEQKDVVEKQEEEEDYSKGSGVNTPELVAKYDSIGTQEVFINEDEVDEGEMNEADAVDPLGGC